MESTDWEMKYRDLKRLFFAAVKNHKEIRIYEFDLISFGGVIERHIDSEKREIVFTWREDGTTRLPETSD